MTSFFRRLPLLAKLLIIAIVPLVFILFLTLQVYHEKTKNLAQVKDYLDHISQSANITRLIDQLQKERRYSFDYALAKTHQPEMLAQRPFTDSLLNALRIHHDAFLNDFDSYVFLEDLDSTRNKIDRGLYNAGQVMHEYSNSIFRLSTLNAAPAVNNAVLKPVFNDLVTQKLLSEQVTYLGLIDANVYNILFTRQYIPETLLGTLGTYHVYRSYEKQLIATAQPEQIAKYKALREHAALKPVSDHIDRLFATFKLDSTYTPDQWNQLSDNALDGLRNLQQGLLARAEGGIRDYYSTEKAARARIIILLVLCIILVIALTTYVLVNINRSLKRLQRAALKIAAGQTGFSIRPESKDSIGSLANSIGKIRENNSELAATARRIGAGEFDTPIAPRSQDDELVNALIQMRNNLQLSTNDLRRSQEAFSTLADMIPQIVWTARPDGHLEYHNKKWYETTGARDAPGDQGWVSILHPEDIGPFLTAWYQCIENGTHYEQKHRFRQAGTNNYRWMLVRALPIRDEEGKVTKWFGTATDIHDQVMQNERLEELVAQRTMELKRSNEDLQQFAHVVSHDLKEPVRKIATFSNWLAEEFGESIPAKGRTYLDKVQASSRRMAGMIDSVLHYSVINATAEQKTETVDLNAVMKGIQNDLELVILQKEAEIHYHHLPKIRAAMTLVYQLFYNLVNNALKFSKPGVPPRVQISGETSDHSKFADHAGLGKADAYVHIIVADNGIGFNQEHADKLFQIFARLNGRDQFEGTGLGLALCKKIVERYQGVIYATGEEGAGAEFHVILPVSKD